MANSQLLFNKSGKNSKKLKVFEFCRFFLTRMRQNSKPATFLAGRKQNGVRRFDSERSERLQGLQEEHGRVELRESQSLLGALQQ